MREAVVEFGRASPLFGIRTTPAGAPRRTAMILINSGVVSRVGANRMTVILARALAELGYETLRFDMSGLGDSPERDDGIPWTASSVAEIREAIDLLDGAARPIVGYGNCGGAAKAFWTACVDARLRGLFLTNPPPHPAEGGPDQVAVEAAQQIVESLRAFFARGGRAAFVHAEGDSGRDYWDRRLAERLSPFLAAHALDLFVVPRSNHTFATAEARRRVIACLTDWMLATFPE